MEVWFRSCSFLNGRYVDSMLIFQGVAVKETQRNWLGTLIFDDLCRELSLSCY